MLKIFYGNDRKAAQLAINKLLGTDYEVVEAENIERGDMDTIFRGTSIFGDVRKILVKSLSENKSCWEHIAEYADTPHDVIVWNAALDKRSVAYKALSKAKIETKEFKIPENEQDKWLAFDVFKLALRGDMKGALRDCKRLESQTEPYSVLGAFASVAYKEIATSRKAAPALKILAKADMDIKNSATEDAWAPIKIALVKIAQL